MSDEIEKPVEPEGVEANPAPPVTPAVETVVTNVVVRPSDWAGKLVLVMAIAAALWGLLGPIGAGWGLWGWRSGLTGLQYSFFLAVAALLLGLAFGWWHRKRAKGNRRWLRWTGMAIALVYAGWMLSWVYTARSVPAIHDISTDLADPPQYRRLALGSDNLDDVPGVDDPKMKGMNPMQRWELLHRQAYGDVRTVRMNEPVADVIAKAERLAQTRGWDIAVADPVEGRMEATATTALFRFKDDVVLRVRPTEDGKGSVIDMRSVSRVGVSDLGVNAKRIRKFLADLSGTVSAT